MSSVSSPPRWTCRACNARNAARFNHCISCDCINPETLYPKAFAAAAAQQTGRSSGGGFSPTSDAQVSSHSLPWASSSAPRQTSLSSSSSSTPIVGAAAAAAELSMPAVADVAVVEHTSSAEKVSFSPASGRLGSPSRKRVGFASDTETDWQLLERASANTRALKTELELRDDRIAVLERAAANTRALTTELALRDDRLAVLERDNLAQREELKSLGGMLVEAQKNAENSAAALDAAQKSYEEKCTAMQQELDALRCELKEFESKRQQVGDDQAVMAAAAHHQQQPSLSDDDAAVTLGSLLREVSLLRADLEGSRREDRQLLQHLAASVVTSASAAAPNGGVQAGGSKSDPGGEEQKQQQQQQQQLEAACAALKLKLDEVTKQRDDFAHDARFNLALLAECRDERATLMAQLLLESPGGGSRSQSNSLKGVQSDHQQDAPGSSIKAMERVTELQKLVAVLEAQVDSVEKSKREAMAAVEHRLDAASFLEEQLRSAQFGSNELKRQCEALREKIATKDFDIAEGQQQLAEAEKKLVAERDFHDRARKDVATLEKQLEAQREEWRGRVDSLNAQLNENQAVHTELLEQYDALEITVEDLRAALADALETLSSRAA